MHRLLQGIFVCLLTHANMLVAEPLGSSITYQGQLTDSGAPANGSYDFQFALYTSDAGGTAVDIVDVPGLVVSGGLINASLDFTDAPYTGQALWIAVSVRPGGSSNSFTMLTPRQPLTAAPYALFALNGNPGPQGLIGPVGPAGASGPPGAGWRRGRARHPRPRRFCDVAIQRHRRHFRSKLAGD